MPMEDLSGYCEGVVFFKEILLEPPTPCEDGPFDPPTSSEETALGSTGTSEEVPTIFLHFKFGSHQSQSSLRSKE